MARKPKGRKRKPPSQHPRKARPQEPSTIQSPRWWPLTAKLGSGALALLAIAGAIATFFPRLSVDLSGPLNPSNPFSLRATVTNAGFLQLRDIEPALSLCEIDLPNHSKILTAGACDETTTRLMPPVWRRHVLAIDDKYTIPIEEFFNFTKSSVESGRIIISIRYRPWYFPFTRLAAFKFVARKREDGSLEWLHDTIE
jgi:hypothetical protein